MDYQNVTFYFSGKRVLVAGGSKGIGKRLVESFLSAGAETVYAARTAMDGPTDATFIRTDLSSESEVLKLFEELDTLGPLHCVVNMAGINYCNGIEDIDTGEWDEVLAANLRAYFIVCREATRRMKNNAYGKIVNVSSIAGRHRSPVSGVHYVSSKAGIIGLTKQLAFELGPHGVNVNALCPSQTMTDMLMQSMTDEQQKALADSIPLRRLASVEEQVGPILFLCSDAAAYITGAVIDVNGGQI